MKKKLVFGALALGVLCAFGGCSDSGSSGPTEGEMYGGDAFDYDNDGVLNNKEMNDYGNFLNDAYEYGLTHQD